MSCHYTIIRYVPKPIAEEFMNIAVVVFDETKAQCRITKNWRRIANFGSAEDLRMLKEFYDRLTEACKNGDRLPIESPGECDRLTGVLSCSGSWQGVIQVADPRGSLEEVGEAIVDLERLYFS